MDVSLDDVDFSDDDLLKSISDRFHKRHEELFTYSLPDQEAVLVNGRLAAIGALPDLPQDQNRSACRKWAPHNKKNFSSRLG